MSADDPFIGEIIAWGGNFAPVGWAFCNGQLMSIAENNALFALIGTTYGGDGQQTFGLPDLQGRVAMDAGNGHVIGERAGVESVSLTSTQVPSHAHGLLAAAVGDASVPTGRAPAPSRAADPSYGDASVGTASMNAGVLVPAGSSLPHDNMQPFLAVNFIISLFGVFPSQS